MARRRKTSDDYQPIGVGMTAKQMKRRKPINSELLLDIEPLTDNQRKLFDTWLNFINPKEKDFDFRYRGDYIGKVTIFQINETGDDISYAVELQEAYPIRIGDVRGTWAEQEVMRLDVELSYRYWRNLSRGEIIGDLDQLIGVTVTGTRKSRDEIVS